MRLRLLILAAIVLWVAPFSRAQSAPYYNQVIYSGGFPFPVIRVCTEVATGTPCNPLAPIFSDVALTVPLANPFNGDATGKFSFYAATSATYHVQVSGVGLLPYDIANITLGGGGGGGGGSGTVSPAAQFFIANYTTAGTSTTVGGIPVPTSPDGVPQLFVSTPSGGQGTPAGFSIPGVAIEAQTGTSFPIPNTDNLHFITGNNGSPTAWAGPVLDNNYAFSFMNLGPGLITYTPNSGTVNGNATQKVPQNWFGFHYTDKVNTTMPVVPTFAAFPNCNGASNGLIFTSATGNFGCNTIAGGGGGGNVSTTPAVGVNQIITQLDGTDAGSNTWNGQVSAVPDFNWVQSPAGTLTASTPATVTLTPCPRGIDASNNTIAPYGVYIAAQGTPEATAVTGGTCTSGAASGTIVFTPANSHGAGYTVGSANSGMQETVNWADGGNSVNGFGGYPFNKVNFLPAGQVAINYDVYWPIFLNAGKTQFTGYGAYLACHTRSVCMMVGDYQGSNAISGHSRVEGFTFQSVVDVDGAHIANVTAASGTFTINTSSAHNLQTGDYVAVYYSTPALTQDGIFKVTVTSSTQFTYVIAGSVTTFSLSNGNGWAALENAALEDEIDGLNLVDIKMQGGTGYFNHGLVIDNDQALTIDNFTARMSGHALKTTANFVGTAIYLRGDQGNAPVGWIKNSEISLSCSGNGIRNPANNSLKVENTVIQGMSQYGIYALAGLHGWEMDNVYEEVSPGCLNPFYGNSMYSQASVIANGGGALTMNGASNTAPPALFPIFDSAGIVAGSCTTTWRNYFVAPQDTSLGSGPLLPIGKACPSGAESITLQWPNPDLVGAGTRTFDVLVTTGATPANSPYGTGNYAVVAGDSGSCNTSGMCSYVDTQAAASSYAVNSAWTWSPTLPFWPGSVVLGKSTNLYIDEISQAGAIIPTFHLPQVFAKRCRSASYPAQYVPTWQVCLAQDSVVNNNGLVGATLFQIGIGAGGSSSGISGGLSFTLGTNGTVKPREIITLMDGVPAQTLATPGYVRTANAGDNFIGTDTAVGFPGAQNQVYGSPGGHRFYVNNASLDGSSWLEDLTATKKTFNVPVTANSDFSILGNCILGCGPFKPGGSQVTDNFNRADGAIGANWTVVLGTWSVASNKVTYTVDGGNNRAMAAYTATTFSNDQFASVTITGIAAGVIQGPSVRTSSVAETGYALWAEGNALQLVKFVAGVATSIGSSFSHTLVVGDFVRIEASGTTITGYLNGTQIVQVTDSAVTSGSPGLVADLPTPGTMDNFAGGDLTFSSANFITLSKGLDLAAGTVLSWNTDTGISRCAADILCLGNGTQGNQSAIAQAKRYTVNGGTTLTSGAFAIGAGWGSTASIAITNTTSKDAAYVVTITTGGSGIAANPTLAITFVDGTWTNVPACREIQTGGNDIFSDTTVSARSATAYTYIWSGTPTTGKTYEFTQDCTGT